MTFTSFAVGVSRGCQEATEAGLVDLGDELVDLGVGSRGEVDPEGVNISLLFQLGLVKDPPPLLEPPSPTLPVTRSLSLGPHRALEHLLEEIRGSIPLLPRYLSLVVNQKLRILVLLLSLLLLLPLGPLVRSRLLSLSPLLEGVEELLHHFPLELLDLGGLQPLLLEHRALDELLLARDPAGEADFLGLSGLPGWLLSWFWGL